MPSTLGYHGAVYARTHCIEEPQSSHIPITRPLAAELRCNPHIICKLPSKLPHRYVLEVTPGFHKGTSGTKGNILGN